MNNTATLKPLPALVLPETSSQTTVGSHLFSLNSLATTLLDTPPAWRSKTLSKIKVAERTVRDWKLSSKIDVPNHSCVLGYAICGLDRNTARALNFETKHNLRLWLAGWDLTYGISHVSDLAATFRITEHFAKASLRKIENDPVQAQKAVWSRIGLMWLAGAAIGIDVPFPPLTSTKTKLKTLESRIKDIADNQGPENKRAALLCRRLILLCAEKNQHPLQNGI